MGATVKVLADLPKVGPLMARSAVTSIGRPGASQGLPDVSLQVASHTQDVARLADYNRVCGFSLRDHVPATWLHVLTFPLQVALMSERSFPFSLAGLVHVSNRMTLHRPVTVDEKLRVTVWAENLQPHKRGVTFDMCGRVDVGGDTVWTGVSNYLASGQKIAGDPPPTQRLKQPEAEPSQLWRLPANLGRQYAAVSGDVNPIHLNPVTARLFGFPRPIIHGMWTHARALAAFGGSLPDAYDVHVSFTKPILLPGKARFATDGQRFAVLNSDASKPYLVGEVASAGSRS